MRTNIHPTYHPKATVTCVCGNTFTTGSTQEAIQTELCSNCHPFYTGKQNLVDTAGRVERFEAMKKRTEAVKQKRTAEKAKKQEPSETETTPEEDTQAKLQELKKTLENK